MEKIKFIIITPFRGNLDWLEETILSVKSQDYECEHKVILDGPEYKNCYLLDKYPGVDFTIREERRGALFNHFFALKDITSKYDNLSNIVVVHLDGDDLFIGNRVLSKVAKEYMNNNVWATYGNYVSRQGSVCKPLSISPRQSIVHGGWYFSHLRTFRAHLIPHLKKEDMFDSNGKWFTSACDTIINCPLLELCGFNRIKFIDEDLVYYRVHNNNDMSVNLQDQYRCAIEAYKKKPYREL